jgi:hypothetical protein
MKEDEIVGTVVLVEEDLGTSWAAHHEDGKVILQS